MMNEVPFDQLTYARFSTLLKTRFRVKAGGANPIELELAEARQLQSRMRQEPRGTLKNECFSLIFHGPSSCFLEQKMYEFEHDSLGAFSLFLVPVGKAGEEFQYEAVFNRIV
jgi:hypothetical protein